MEWYDPIVIAGGVIGGAVSIGAAAEFMLKGDVRAEVWCRIKQREALDSDWAGGFLVFFDKCFPFKKRKFFAFFISAAFSVLVLLLLSVVVAAVDDSFYDGIKSNLSDNVVTGLAVFFFHASRNECAC